MKYLIAGRSGQLARAFINRLSAKGAEFLAPDEADLDITSEAAIEDACASFRPDVILNCAAYNLVDKAEVDSAAAMKVNVEGPALLARAAGRHRARMVHFGSDYVFDGTKKDGLYTEDDHVNPLSVYGRSKLEGETSVASETEDYLVLRLSWVFGEGTQNFIHKLRGWADSNEYLSIVCDEFSVPTYTYTVADVTLKAIESGLNSGLYNLVNSGYCSRYEWAKFTLKALGIDKFIRPVNMDSFDLPAKRPGFSAMGNARISDALDISIPLWEEAVGEFLKRPNNG